MMQIGILNAYFPYGLEESARRIRALGFNAVQLDLTFKDMDLSPGTLTRDKCRRIRDAFRAHDLPICAVSGYTNIVHPDPEARRRKVEALKEVIRFARELGSPYVVSETGTFATESDWISHPRNRTEEGYEQCVRVIAELVREAHDAGAVFLVETYVNNVIGSVEETLRLFADIDHAALGLLMDPTNYFESHNIDDMDAVLNRIFDALGDRVRIAHAKDVKRAGDDKSEKHADIDAPEGHTFRGVGEIELPPPGLGALNYDLYLKRLSERSPNIPIIVEHLDEADAPRAKAFLADRLRAVGC